MRSPFLLKLRLSMLAQVGSTHWLAEIVGQTTLFLLEVVPVVSKFAFHFALMKGRLLAEG